MPINKTLYNKLVNEYGEKKGKSVYFGLESKGSKSFQKGLATAKKEGHTMAHAPKSKKRGKKK